MKSTDPQFLYMILILPAIFGLTLIGEGINKMMHEEGSGLANIFFGLIFVGIVVFAYFFFSNVLNASII